MSIRFAATAFLVTVMAIALVEFSARAQSPAPSSGGTTDPSKAILANALSPQTRQILQEAIDEADASTSSTLDIGPGEGAELDGTKADRVDFAALPGPLRDALGGGTRQTLSNGAGR